MTPRAPEHVLLAPTGEWGAEQSGHINAVGIETYLKMLEDTVAELKGEAVLDEISVVLDFPLQVSVPETYVGDANLRMEIYQRLASGHEDQDLIGRYGRIGEQFTGARKRIGRSTCKAPSVSPNSQNFGK